MKTSCGGASIIKNTSTRTHFWRTRSHRNAEQEQRSALQRPVAVLLLNRKTDLYTVEHQAAHTLCKQAVGQPWLQWDARGGPGVVVMMRINPSLPPVDCQ
jgi:hypothetical protein